MPPMTASSLKFAKMHELHQVWAFDNLWWPGGTE